MVNQNSLAEVVVTFKEWLLFVFRSKCLQSHGKYKRYIVHEGQSDLVLFSRSHTQSMPALENPIGRQQKNVLLEYWAKIQRCNLIVKRSSNPQMLPKDKSAIGLRNVLYI